jgi:hypothetical protein
MAARFTFREPAGAVCWQRQLRDRYSSEGTPSVPHLDVRKAVVRPVSRKLAEQIILRYEWLGTMAPTSFHFGIFFGAYCAGVTCIGYSACTAGTTVHRQFMLRKRDVLTLARGACVHWAPPGANSRLVAWTARLLAKNRAGKILLAYSDTDAGEVGTIYQACNWVYAGCTSRPDEAQFISPSGVIRDSKFVGNHARKMGVTYSRLRAEMLGIGWKAQSVNPKHRYVCVLDRSDARRKCCQRHVARPGRKGRCDSDPGASRVSRLGGV